MKRLFYFITAALIFGLASGAQAQSVNIVYGDREFAIDEQQVNDFITKVTNKVERAAEKLEHKLENLEENIEKGDYKIVIDGKEPQRFRGSGNIITESRIVPDDYHGIITSRAIKVTLEDRNGSTAIIRADDNVMPHIKIEDHEGVLEIKIDDKIRTINNITAEVRLPKSEKINHLEASSAARINVNYTIHSATLNVESSSAAGINIAKADVTRCNIDTSSAANVVASIKASECHIDAASAANVKAHLLVNKCYAESSSAAKITLSGEAGTLNLEASSAANINATEAKALVKTVADASSGADIKVNAGKSLSANASSGGTVAYKAEHDVDVHIIQSSGGNVRKL